MTRALHHLESGEWQRAHEIVQHDEVSPLYCWAHGIVHLMEGDLSNARYWYAQAGRAFRDDLPGEIESLRKSLFGL